VENGVPKRLILGQHFTLPVYDRGDSMADIIRTGRARPALSVVPGDISSISDEECLFRLAQAVKEHDSSHLDEVARLIARLVVTIE
jgi:hypothetical protein